MHPHKVFGRSWKPRDNTKTYTHTHVCSNFDAAALGTSM